MVLFLKILNWGMWQFSSYNSPGAGAILSLKGQSWSNTKKSSSKTLQRSSKISRKRGLMPPLLLLDTCTKGHLDPPAQGRGIMLARHSLSSS